MKKPEDNTYCIEFDTEDMPGLVKATQVELRTVILHNDDSVRIDLAEHPLYRQLQEYVLSNPRPRAPK